MIFRILFSTIVLASTTFFAQTGTVSPYSFIGLGESSFKGNSINRFMGGLDVFTDSIHANLNNPSGYAKLKATVYSLGVNYNEINLKNSSSKENSKSSSLDYFAIAIPANKFGFGFGIIPSSSVGYKLQSQEGIESDVLKRFNGKGGVNKAFLSIGFNLMPFLSVGGTLNYNFGKIELETYENSKGIDYGTYLESISYFSGFDYQIAANLTFTVNKKYELQSYFSISPKTKLTSKNQRVLFTRSTSTQSIGDFKEIDLNSYNLAKTKVSTYSKFDMGLGFGEKFKWYLGSQFTSVNAESYKNDFINYDNLIYTKGYKMSMGGFYIPNFISISDYWKRVAYRGGIRIEKPGILIENKHFIENAASFGVSLPVAGLSNADIGFEIGNRKIKDTDAFKETFWSIRLGFSLIDIWFVKRKYN